MSEPPLHPEYEPIFIDGSLEPSDVRSKDFLNNFLGLLGYQPDRRTRPMVHRLCLRLYEAQIEIDDSPRKFAAIYTGPEFCSRWGVTPSVVKTLRKKLLEAGYIQNVRRYHHLTFDSYAQKASTDLFALKLPMMDRYLTEVAVQTFKYALATTDTTAGATIKNDKFLEEINAIIIQGNVRINGRISVSGVRRSFTDFKKKRGGRFYGPYTNLSKDLRLRQVTVLGESICEVDISSCNLTLLAAMKGAELPDGDLYSGFGVDREVVKKTIVEMFGTGNSSKPRLSAASKADLFEQGFAFDYDHKALIGEINVRFPFLKELQPKVCDSETMAYYESVIVGNAILNLWKKHRLASLPMHDCLMVPRSHPETAKHELIESFQEHCANHNWNQQARFRAEITCGA